MVDGRLTIRRLTVPAARTSPQDFIAISGRGAPYCRCGWEFTHAQTVALHAGGVAAAIATCLRFLPGDTVVCAAVGAWLGAHVAPGAHQCLYVSTLPVGVIKYVSC
jgi:hypothetical protein